ncbi:MAG TPA: UV DNA damage repair endonuclease UvsE [Nitrososphaeraceae archaeon]|nr:UV DNA damage repair endonuclease UvsE [Nitrososphaeraceae archaeon]
MKIGYPCINTSIQRHHTSTFRLASYSEMRLIQTIRDNLAHLEKILKFNVENRLLFFRISSDLVPFASHPICKFNWIDHFKSEFKHLGEYIKANNIRISMHPDQFVILNSSNEKVTNNSINELKYHCNILDAMDLDQTAKVQIHVGGVYGDKPRAIKKFIECYSTLTEAIKKRIAIENDDHLFNLKDCLEIHQQTGIPIIFDNFHHECFNYSKESMIQAIKKASLTWKVKDGLPMLDYSSQSKGERKGKHATTLDPLLFCKFIMETQRLDFDLMLEIKDKEKSALAALKLLFKI